MDLYHKINEYLCCFVFITDYWDRHAIIKEGYKCESMKSISSQPISTIHSNPN